jgi:HEAT repeat protein
LSRIGAPPSPGLIRRLDDADPRRRVEAAILLREFFGPRARAAVPRLDAALNDPVPLVRVSAAAALAAVDPTNARAVPALITALDSTDIEVLEPAVSAIGAIGPKARAAVPKLKTIVSRNDLTHPTYTGERLEGTIDSIKIGAAEALVAVSPHTGEGASAFLALLEHGDSFVKAAALEHLRELGPKAAAAVPALAAIARAAASPQRYDAVKALSRIDPQHEAILPALIDLLKDPRAHHLDLDQEGEIILTIGWMGPKALPAVPALVQVLEDKDEATRDGGGPADRAARALGRIGPADRGHRGRARQDDEDRTLRPDCSRRGAHLDGGCGEARGRRPDPLAEVAGDSSLGRPRARRARPRGPSCRPGPGRGPQRSEPLRDGGRRLGPAANRSFTAWSGGSAPRRDPTRSE